MSRSPRLDAIRAAVSAVYPNAGPCAFCGLPDKRHRMFEAIQGCVAAGDSVADTAEGYGIPIETVQAIVDAPRPTRRDWQRLGAIQP